VCSFHPRAPIDLLPLMPFETTCFDASKRYEFFNPRAPIDLLPLMPFETTCFDASKRYEFIHKMHEITKLNIETMNDKHRIASSKGREEVKLEPGDLVWLHLRKE
jgi:translation initiation factor IF-1